MNTYANAIFIKYFIKVSQHFKTIILYVCLVILQMTIPHEAAAKTQNMQDSEEYIVHEIKENDEADINPIFKNPKQEVSIGYFSALGLGDAQTLNLNGAYIGYSYPWQFGNSKTKLFATLSFGGVSLTSQDIAVSPFYFGFLAGFEVTTPISTSNIISHLVFGADIGMGILSSGSNFTFDTYIGSDFVYKRYVIRPFIGITIYPTFGNNIGGFGFYGDLGLKMFYHFQQSRLFFSVLVRRDFFRSDLGVFVVMPNNKAMYLGPKSTSFEVDLGVELFTWKYLNVKGNIGGLYTVDYPFINANIGLSATYRF